MTFSSLDNIDRSLATAVASAKAGDEAAARRLLRYIVSAAPDNPRAWLWLAHVAQTVEEKRMALRRALILRPEDARLQKAFADLISTRQIQQAAKSGVFINYNRQDDFFAVELAETLREAHVPVWIDIADIPARADWNEAIRQALHSCGVMLTIISRAALRDTQARSEQKQFLHRGKIVIPVVREVCDVEALKILHPPVEFYRDHSLAIITLLDLLKSTDYDISL